MGRTMETYCDTISHSTSAHLTVKYVCLAIKITYSDVSVNAAKGHFVSNPSLYISWYFKMRI
jgi:hypothetical protein